jgi:hypothetical protein
MTETSDEEEELIKLIKNRKVPEKGKDTINHTSQRTKSRSRSSQAFQKETYNSESKFIKNS